MKLFLLSTDELYQAERHRRLTTSSYPWWLRTVEGGRAACVIKDKIKYADMHTQMYIRPAIRIKEDRLDEFLALPKEKRKGNFHCVYRCKICKVEYWQQTDIQGLFLADEVMMNSVFSSAPFPFNADKYEDSLPCLSLALEESHAMAEENRTMGSVPTWLEFLADAPEGLVKAGARYVSLSWLKEYFEEIGIARKTDSVFKVLSWLTEKELDMIAGDAVAAGKLR